MENLDTDLPLPPEAIPVTAENLAEPKSNSWLPFTGDLDLRAAVSDFLAARTGHNFDPEREIVITSGGMEGLLDVALAVVDPGDEVIVTDPTYAGIVNRIHLAGGIPRFAPFHPVDGEWRLDRDALTAAIGPKTRAMLLMSPSMPSGGWFDELDWRLICDLCCEHELGLIYDSAMERLLFDGRPLLHPLRFEGMVERTVVVGSLSKEHRMIGWRVGWVVGPAATIEDVGWVHVYNTTMPTGLSRTAAAAVLRGDQGHVQECVDELERRRDLLLSRAARLAFRPPRRRLVDAARRRVARHRTGRGIAAAAGGVRHRSHRHDRLGRCDRCPATSAGSSAPSRATAWQRSPSAWKARSWQKPSPGGGSRYYHLSSSGSRQPPPTSNVIEETRTQG